MIKIYTDGSYNEATKTYGWAFVAFDNTGKEVIRQSGSNTGDAAAMRNVAGELSAVMHGIKAAHDCGENTVVICHDYTGCGMWARNEWKAKNAFTQAYIRYLGRFSGMQISFKCVHGHAGIGGNVIADKLARAAAGNKKKIVLTSHT